MKRFFVLIAIFTAMVCAVGCNRKPELQWSEVSPLVNWNQAVDYCYNLREGGFNDWRVPDIDELRSLFVDCPATKIGGECQISEKEGKLSIRDVSSACKGCEITDYGKYVNSKNGWYASSSVFNYDKGQHWWMMNGVGALDVDTDQRAQGYVQCVRVKNPRKNSQNLTWSNKSSELMNWQQALTYCQNLKENKLDDWRLPNIDELRTLLIADRVSSRCKVSERNNCLSAGSCWSCSTCTQAGTPSSNGRGCSDWGKHYTDGRYSKFGDTDSLWSSSVRSEHDGLTYTWYVNFDSGYVLLDSNMVYHDDYVRCVRGEDKISKLLLESMEALKEEATKEEAPKPAEPTKEPVKEESAKEETENNTAKELQWSNKAAEKMFARDAVDYCENLSENGHDDWRLPTINELRSLIQNCEETKTGGSCGVTDACLSQNDCKNKACDGCEDKTVQYSKLGDKGLFWSSSFRPESSNNAWYIDFTYASVHGHSDGKKSVRCVR